MTTHYLIQKLISEHATTDVLTNCLIDNEDVDELLAKWQATHAKLTEAPVSLNPIDCITYRLNEIAENKIVRIIQLYELIRCRKLLENSNFILEIQNTNANVELISDEEAALAKFWRSYLHDHDLFIQENRTHFVHFSPAIDQLDVSTYARMLNPEADEDDPALVKMVAEARKHADPSDDLLPYNFTQCYLQESLRQGLYKSRFKAEL